MIDRRTFLAGAGAGHLAAPLTAEAQQAGKVHRIGMLETTSMALNAANIEAFRQGLRELGTAGGATKITKYQRPKARTNRSRTLQANQNRKTKVLNSIN